ncbi:cytochrome P450 3A24-like [Mya arenaria]|uniref:cytochrome P450 3A24-like n=1 Tax=Mya arenaria TaxID=6604 RepID=UPI0022DED6D8|nr:cytochrome P450 3A24-like [Mya arenaria]
MLLLGIIELPLWLLFIVTIVFLFYIYTSRKHSIFARYRLPFVEPSPFFGCFKHLAQKGVMQSEYDATLKYGKVVGFFLGNLPTIFVTDPEIIRELFVKRYNEFHSRSQAAGVTKYWEKTILMASRLEYWKFLRTTMTPSFTSGKLRRMEDIIIGGIDRTLKGITIKLGPEKEAVFDMFPVYRDLTLEIICQAALGVEINGNNSVDELKQQVTKMLSYSLEKNPMLTMLFLIPDLKHVYNFFDIDYNDTKAIAYVSDALKQVIQDRKLDKGCKKQDLLQLMINTQQENSKSNAKTEETDETEETEKLKTDDKLSRGMTDDEIIANAILFLFAGNDTTSTALVFTTYFLAVHQDLQDELVQEINEKVGTTEVSYDIIQTLTNLDMFVSESMRLYPPVTRINRQITKEVKVSDFTLPRNISLTVPVYTIHRLAEYWPEPEKFDPNRFSAENKSNIQPYTYLPFGTGPKSCLGMRFANMELKMTIVKLLQNFKIKPSPDLQIPPKLEKNIFCRPIGGMKLTLEKRSS